MRQNLQMQIPVKRCRDHEEQIRGLPVRCTVVDTARNRHRRKPRSYDRLTLRMRNGNAFSDRGTGFRLTLHDTGCINSLIGNVSCLFLHVDQCLNGRIFGIDLRVDQHRFRLDQITNFHYCILLSISSAVARPGEQAVADPAAVPSLSA